MGVRNTTFEEKTALYDSVTGLAFGPVFDDPDDADAFLEHLVEIGERDPRVIPDGILAELAAEFLKSREAPV
jgi:hypothetical protein